MATIRVRSPPPQSCLGPRRVSAHEPSRRGPVRGLRVLRRRPRPGRPWHGATWPWDPPGGDASAAAALSSLSKDPSPPPLDLPSPSVPRPGPTGTTANSRGRSGRSRGTDGATAAAGPWGEGEEGREERRGDRPRSLRRGTVAPSQPLHGHSLPVSSDC